MVIETWSVIRVLYKERFSEKNLQKTCAGT